MTQSHTSHLRIGLSMYNGAGYTAQATKPPGSALQVV
jgi:hypothetical protein